MSQLVIKNPAFSPLQTTRNTFVEKKPKQKTRRFIGATLIFCIVPREPLSQIYYTAKTFPLV